MNSYPFFELKDESMGLLSLFDGSFSDIFETNYEIERNFIKVNSFKIKDEHAFKELGFCIFLKWFFKNKKNSGIRKNIDQYTFLGLNQKTIFLFKTENSNTIFPFSNIFSDDVMGNMLDGQGRHSICNIPNLIRYNLGLLGGFDDLIDFPPYYLSQSDCDEHRSKIRNWLIEKIENDGNFGKMLGGQFYLVDLDPSLVELISTREEDEALLNSFFALYSLSLKSFEYISTNCEIIKPFKTHEIDVLLLDETKNQLLVLETTLERKIGRNHLKRKMYNSAVINAAQVANYVYIYLTTGKIDDISLNTAHGALFNVIRSMNNVPFYLISAPSSFNLTFFNLREIYNYFLEELEKSINDV